MARASGSERAYWRLKGNHVSSIGAYHPVKEETRAFLEFTRHFLKNGMKVPQIYFSGQEQDIYLIEDLGDTTLFSLINEKPGNQITPELISHYRNALEELVKFQVLAGQGLDYETCYPRKSFDRQSISWDLDYFKYSFLKLHLGFNEQKLEDDFQRLKDFLLEAPSGFFMYRDFQ